MTLGRTHGTGTVIEPRKLDSGRTIPCQCSSLCRIGYRFDYRLTLLQEGRKDAENVTHTTRFSASLLGGDYSILIFRRSSDSPLSASPVNCREELEGSRNDWRYALHKTSEFVGKPRGL